MNDTALLALISNLYHQLLVAQARIQELEDAIAQDRKEQQ